MIQSAEDKSLSASPEEKAHAKRLLRRIKSFESQLKDRAKGWAKARQYADGNPGDDGEKGLVRVNLIGSQLEAIQPAIYAKAPEIAVTLDDRPTTHDYEMLKNFSETLQAALDVFLVKDAHLKDRGKSAVRAALTTTIGWVKVVYQIERRDDPIIKNRINDTQDNIDRVNTLVKETSQEGGECGEYEAKIYELKHQIDALNKDLEVIVSEGIVIDSLAAEDLIILDSSCRDIDDFMQAPEIAHKIKMTVGTFKTQFGMSPPTGAKKYSEDDSVTAKDQDEDDFIINVYEVWSLKDMTVYTLCEGSASYVREPYQPETLGEQWYPFFGLQLRRVDNVVYPQSMVEQLIELQDEYNTRRTNSSEHRRKNIPVRVINKSSGITNEEVTAVNNRSIDTDVIAVTMDSNIPLGQQIASLPEIPYNPQMYDTSDIMRDMEMVGNTQDAARGAINKAKTATEAEIMATGMQSRTSEALDIIEDWLSNISIYCAQLLLQNMPSNLIKQRFGEDAVWPELDKKTLFEMVDISIRAGSTSRPNRLKERDQWMQLLPMIQQTIEKIEVFKQQGLTSLVEVSIKLLDETLKRFDETLDAKQLLGVTDEDLMPKTQPAAQPPQPGQPADPSQMPPEVMQMIQQGMQ